MTLKVTERIAEEVIQCDGYELLKLYDFHNLLTPEASLCFIQCWLSDHKTFYRVPIHVINLGEKFFVYESETHFFNCSKFVHAFVKRFGIFKNDFVIEG